MADKSERFYRSLRIGKIREAEVAVAISRYALTAPDGVRLSVYSPEIDIDAIDAILRIETERDVQFVEIQVTSTKPKSIRVDPRLLRSMKKYEQKGKSYLIVCTTGKETMEDMFCLDSSKLLSLLQRTGKRSVLFSTYDSEFGKSDLRAQVDNLVRA
jgi:hypothetical protein